MVDLTLTTRELRNALDFNIPDPPILAFSNSLLFLFSDFPFFLRVFLFFPGILGVPQREKPLLFSCVSPCFFQKARARI